MDKFSFFDLRVYQESKQLVKDVYSLLEKFPKFEVYALGDQLRRQWFLYHRILQKVLEDLRLKNCVPGTGCR